MSSECRRKRREKPGVQGGEKLEVAALSAHASGSGAHESGISLDSFVHFPTHAIAGERLPLSTYHYHFHHGLPGLAAGAGAGVSAAKGGRDVGVAGGEDRGRGWGCWGDALRDT
jgi:hypothetical protein